jgi:hypothetical protein
VLQNLLILAALNTSDLNANERLPSWDVNIAQHKIKLNDTGIFFHITDDAQLKLSTNVSTMRFGITLTIVF